MARPQTRFVVAGLVLALLLALVPMASRAQTSSELFAEGLASEAVNAPLAGPNALDLAQAPGVLTVFKAGLDVADFVAHAEFVNPEVVDGVGWRVGRPWPPASSQIPPIPIRPSLFSNLRLRQRLVLLPGGALYSAPPRGAPHDVTADRAPTRLLSAAQ